MAEKETRRKKRERRGKRERGENQERKMTAVKMARQAKKP